MKVQAKEVGNITKLHSSLTSLEAQGEEWMDQDWKQDLDCHGWTQTKTTTMIGSREHSWWKPLDQVVPVKLKPR